MFRFNQEITKITHVIPLGSEFRKWKPLIAALLVFFVSYKTEASFVLENKKTLLLATGFFFLSDPEHSKFELFERRFVDFRCIIEEVGSLTLRQKSVFDTRYDLYV